MLLRPWFSSKILGQKNLVIPSGFKVYWINPGVLDKKTIGTSIGGTGALLATGEIVLSKRRGQSCHLPVVDWVEKQYFSSAYEESMETSESMESYCLYSYSSYPTYPLGTD